MWDWIEKTPKEWGFLLRVIIKAAILFVLCNLIFALVYPMETLGRLSLYNSVFPARPRLPYAQEPSLAYNVSVNNIPAMFASHSVTQAKADDEFRVILIGDSATWGWLLENDETLSSQLNQLDLTFDERRMVFYNLAYPFRSLTKDILILDEAMLYEPDMVLWMISMRAIMPDRQYSVTLVQQNQARIANLVENYDLNIDTQNSQFLELSLYNRTIVGQRHVLADLWRFQSYGLSWMATGIDQFIKDDYKKVRNDFETDISWNGYSEPTELTSDTFRFDILSTAVQRADPVPILFVNEPIFIADGLNSDLHYNSHQPSWAYDQYRAFFASSALENGWNYVDLWDSIDAHEFTNTPLHYSPTGAYQLALSLYPYILEVARD